MQNHLESPHKNLHKLTKKCIQNYKTVTRYMKFENDSNIYKDEENIEHYPLFMIMFI